MGYVAPIRMVQYSEYQQRVQERSKARDPMPVHFTPRIRLSPRMQMETYRERHPFNHREKQQDVGLAESIIDGKLPEQTGKGQFINEYV